MANLILDAALEYAARGWPVLALLPSEKHPRRAKPAGYVPADGSSFVNTKDPDTVRKWWGKYPGDDVGIETGRVAGFWVLDIDGDEGERAFAELVAKHGELPRTVTSRSGSGKGRHFLFRHPGFKIKTKARWHGLPIDTKGDGGQFVAPPSSHKSGNRYEWLIGPDDCEIAEAPAWLLDWFKPKPTPAPVSYSPPRIPADHCDIAARAAGYVATMDASISENGGHKAAIKVASKLRWGYGLDEATAYDIFVSEFNSRCEPPWSEKEILHKIAEGAKPDPYGRPYCYMLMDDESEADDTTLANIDWENLNGGPILGGDGASEAGPPVKIEATTEPPTTATVEPATPANDTAMASTTATEPATDPAAASACPNCERVSAEAVCECGFKRQAPTEPIGDAGGGEITAVESVPEPLAFTGPVEPGSFPVEVFDRLPGFIGDVVRYNLETTDDRQPEIALAGALALASVLTGRKVRNQRNNRTNILAIALANSGAGKNHSRRINERILSAAGAIKLCGPERLGSHAGIINWLHKRPSTLFQVDEIGDLLSTMKASGSKDGHLRNIEATIKQLYSAADAECFTADAYADVGRVRTISQPHLVLYGSTTPTSYWGAISADNVENGLLSRMMVFESPGYNPPTMDEPPAKDVPDSVKAWAEAWFRLRTVIKADLNEDGLEAKPEPKVLEYSADAAEIMKLHVFQVKERRLNEPDRQAVLWSRTPEKTAILSMLFACARAYDPAAEDFKIEREDVELAKLVANWLTRRMVYQVFNRVADNAEESRKKRLLSLIPFAPNRTTLSELTRATQTMSKTDRQNALADLTVGQLVVQEKASKKAPMFLYRPTVNRGGQS